MKRVSVTEFRRRASTLLSEVEAGEALMILRRGRPIAKVSPVTRDGAIPSWKQPGLRLTVPGAALSAAILEKRGAVET